MFYVPSRLVNFFISDCWRMDIYERLMFSLRREEDRERERKRSRNERAPPNWPTRECRYTFQIDCVEDDFLFVSDENSKRSPSFLLEEVAIRRKLCHRGLCRRCCCANTWKKKTRRNNGNFELRSTNWARSWNSSSGPCDALIFRIESRTRFNNIVFQAATMPAQRGSSA